jgi:hypothetical protein
MHCARKIRHVAAAQALKHISIQLESFSVFDHICALMLQELFTKLIFSFCGNGLGLITTTTSFNS